MAALDTTRLNELFDLLSHPYRRYALYYLTEESDVVDVETLATSIAAWDGNQTKTGRHDDHHVETVLRHSHLPRLADAGVIALGENADTVELREADGFGGFLGDTMPIDDYTPIPADD